MSDKSRVQSGLCKEWIVGQFPTMPQGCRPCTRADGALELQGISVFAHRVLSVSFSQALKLLPLLLAPVLKLSIFRQEKY
jgi:hypothetical protein